MTRKRVGSQGTRGVIPLELAGGVANLQRRPETVWEPAKTLQQGKRRAQQPPDQPAAELKKQRTVKDILVQVAPELQIVLCIFLKENYLANLMQST